MNSKAPGMFDNVVIRNVPETASAGLAGLEGQLYGVTTPSSTGIEFLGDQSVDCAFNVHIEALAREVWLSPDLVERVDHAPGTTLQVDEGPEMVRQAEGTWRASRDSRARRIWRWPVLAVLLLAGLFCLNLAAFHTWAGSGPPSPRPEWHLDWAFRFLLLALALFFAGGVVWRKSRES